MSVPRGRRYTTPMRKKKIVIVEDQKDLAGQLATRLREQGYHVTSAHNGIDGLRLIQSDPPALALLGKILPGLSGGELTKQLRNDPRTADLAILILAPKGNASAEIEGLLLGADDYITQPFSMGVLVARVEALLRRTSPRPAQTQPTLQVGPIEIDPERQVTTIHGKAIHLTLTEFRLLAALALARGRVLSRIQLIDQAIGLDALVTDRTIDVHLTSLRRKLGAEKRFLKTVRGRGYQILQDPTMENA